MIEKVELLWKDDEGNEILEDFDIDETKEVGSILVTLLTLKAITAYSPLDGELKRIADHPDLKGVAGALGYAITSVVKHEATLTYKGETETLDFSVIERLLISEFWNALNRRKIVPNDRVDPMIAKTYAKMKLRRA